MARTLVLCLALVFSAAIVRNAVADIPYPGYCGSDHPIPVLDAPFPATLLQAQIMVRHGDRTPAFNHQCWVDNTAVWECDMSQLQLSSTTPTETTASPSRLFRKMFEPGAEVLPSGNCGLGQLTTVGYNQQVNNGKFLREAYVERLGFLPPSWLDDPEAFHLRSDNSLRTQESAQAVFTGLYPSDTDRLATKPRTGGIPVIPFYVEDEQTDTMTYNPTRCPGINNLVAVISNSSGYQKRLKTVTEPLAKEASVAFGLPVPPTGWSNGGINTKLDCLMTHRCHNFSLPSTVTEELFNAIIEDDTWQYGYQLNYTGFVNLAVGTFLGELLDNAKTMIAKHQADINPSAVPPPPRQARKFWLYAGHDDGPIMPMMAALGAYHGVWSPYATLIALELYNSSASAAADADAVEAGLRGAAATATPDSGAPSGDMQYYVRAIVLGQVVQMPGCSSKLCPFAEFEAFVAKLVPTAEQCATGVF